jgi:hypothetical protein
VACCFFYTIFGLHQNHGIPPTMDQDKELLRAMIERRQQMLAKMGDQIKREHLGIDQKLDDLISALNDKMLLQEDSIRQSLNFSS